MIPDPAWILPDSEVFQLLPKTVHVWRLLNQNPDALLERCQALLNQAEQERVQRYYFERDKVQFAATRGLLRILLGKYLGLSPREFLLEEGLRGKPVLKKNPNTRPLHFNVAHSYHVSVLAFSWDYELGVDVEKVDPEREYQKIAERHFSPGELKIFRETPEAKKIAVFYHFWTLKEALLKAWGEGLNIPLDAIEISEYSSSPGFRALKPGVPTHLQEGSLLRLPDPAPRFFAALAVQGGRFALQCYEGSDLIQPAS